MATLKDYFIKDFSQYHNISAEHNATFFSGKVIPYEVRVHLDFDSCSNFISIFVPYTLDPIELTKHYADDINRALQLVDGIRIEGKIGTVKLGSLNELSFSKRLFIYSEQEISEKERDMLEQYCGLKGLKLAFRSSKYCVERNRFEKPEAFISHDSRDKKEVAEELAFKLQKLSCPVWYDEFSLRLGASLRESIEKGIKEARKCIIILSPNFFSNNGWTKAEFTSIYTREIIEKKNVILPVWHKVSKEEVYNYSPMLVDRKAAKTEDGIDEVVRQIHLELRRTASEV